MKKNPTSRQDKNKERCNKATLGFYRIDKSQYRIRYDTPVLREQLIKKYNIIENPGNVKLSFSNHTSPISIINEIFHRQYNKIPE